MHRPMLLWLMIGCINLGLHTASAQGPNLFPDPSFEAGGVVGPAHTGTRAGYLRVDALNHWAAIGPRLTVEPFARYRVSEWVKARIGKGSFYAPYCYEWNNYEWRYVAQNVIKSSDDWVKVEITFVSPHDTMYVHPLAYIDAENCEAWVDDVVVEKIAEPEATIAALLAKPSIDGEDAELLARWYVSRGQLDKAAAVLARTKDRLARADIACVLAQNTADPVQRKQYVVEMIAANCFGYHDGQRRFEEVTADLTPTQRLALCAEAAVANASNAQVGAAYRRAVGGFLQDGDALATVSESRDLQTQARDSLIRVLAAIPEGSAVAKEAQGAMKDLQEAAARLDARKAQLGHCEVSVGGQPLRRTTHAVIIPNQPTPQEYHAARDLRYHLELVTGECLPLWYEHDADKAIGIYVGKCERTKALRPPVDYQALGLEGIAIRTDGPNLFLTGNQRGVLYAVYCFLEDTIGCRWFTPDCSIWPTTGAVRVRNLNRTYVPPLEYRGTDYPSSRQPDWAVRNRYNGNNHTLDVYRGWNIRYQGFVHTFNSLVPPEKYFATHPEYYSEINGKRIGPDRTQLCLTNPEVLAIATNTVRQWIRANPQASIISVSQNDWHNYCQCANCRALAEKEGSQSGPLLHFVNAIADAIKDEAPNVAIDTLAYQYTRKPPKYVKPRPNVIVRLCSIECCFLHPLETDPYNSTFVDDIKGWNEKCQRLYIWDYVINYAHSVCPFPNLYVLKPNINFFIAHGVKGIYEEACYYTKASELQELRSYIMAKTLWDPSYDTDTAIDEFCAAYYGAAAPYVREYINLIHREPLKNPNLHIRIYTHPREYVTQDMIEQSMRLFDQAEAAVKDDPVKLQRVQIARLPIMYAAITLGTGGLWKQDNDRLVQQGRVDISALVDRFEQIARKAELTRIREGGPDATLDAWLQRVPRQPKEIKLERISNGKLELTVIPAVGGRIFGMKLLPEGRELIRKVTNEGLLNPQEGGYEEYSEGTYRTPGWSEAYGVTARTGRSITLQTNLGNGLRMTRTYELDTERPVVKITSVLSNPGKETRTGALRVHPEFAVTSTAQCELKMRAADGTWRSVSLAHPEDPSAEKEEYFSGADMPAGAWAVVDRGANLALLNRFETDKLRQVMLNFNGRDSRVNLELYGQDLKLAPGESYTLVHQYEVVSPASDLK